MRVRVCMYERANYLIFKCVLYACVGQSLMPKNKLQINEQTKCVSKYGMMMMMIIIVIPEN